MIKISEKMRKLSHERVDSVCQKVDTAIKRATENGKCCCTFMCDMDGDADVYDVVRRLYEMEGYRIKPYGYSGGVWQRSEIICW